MGLDISAFRGGDDRIVLDQGLAQGPATKVLSKKATVPFRNRVVGWLKGDDSQYGTVEQQQENRELKIAFYQALLKSEGPRIANAAIARAGLRPGWASSAKPLDKPTRKQVFKYAQQYRMRAIERTRTNFKAFMSGRGRGSFADLFAAVARAQGYPEADGNDAALRKLVEREMGRSPDFAKRDLTATDFDRIAREAITKFYDQRASAFREQHAGLARFTAVGLQNTPREDARTFFTELSAKLSPTMAQGHPLSTEPRRFRDLAARTLEEVRTTTPLMGKMAYEPEGWDQLDRELRAKFDSLAELSGQLQHLDDGDQPGTADGQQLHDALVREIRHQQKLITEKLTFLEDIRQSDPLSKKRVAYSNLMWAHATAEIIDQAKEWLRAHPPPDGTVDLELQLDRAKVDLIKGAQTAYERAPTDQRTILPGQVDKEQHPVVVAKQEAKRFLEATLRQAGLPPDQIRKLTSSAKMNEARRLALNNNQSWAPVRRRMVIHRDGLTRTYESSIVPGININARLRRRYLSSQPLEQGGPEHKPRYGTSSATKDDPYHARNLKLSTLDRVKPDGNRERMLTVVGHGVNDQWDTEDPDERSAANRRTAKEVVETAFDTNDRVRTEALRRKATGDNRPVKITHVSVNLVTPSKPRDVLIAATGRRFLPHHMEARYTDEQFAAFEANTTAGNQGQPVKLVVDDPDPNGLGQDVELDVDVDVIAFSFAINPLATGRGIPDVVAGWTHVYEKNRQSMERFIGDLGTGREGSYGSKPGGFIGSVYDRLDQSDPEQAALAAQIREQTDLVRKMFTSEDFKRGSGDPAKMGRHILYLQALADKALEVTGATDQAATASKGCKSDKDRGGVTDVELKHMAITEDMGGQILPNQKLEGDDRRSYVDVAAGSLQEYNQMLNTGVPGSKEQGKLRDKITEEAEKRYVQGLGSFASE
ncbi:MAG TPA: inositol phosphate phosphatase SopB [Geminicoccaceae bacterium]|nr:inositol phosphate phosphatase SopB [Geminicoccaceae bacterium]